MTARLKEILELLEMFCSISSAFTVGGARKVVIGQFSFCVSKVKWRSASKSTACGRKTKPAVFANLSSFLLCNIRAMVAGHR
jgi:hypothetical protein